MDARTVLCSGQWLSADGSTTVRGGLDCILQHFASTGERARDGKRNGALPAGGVESEAGDADSRTAVGRRERGVLSLAQRRALWRAAVAIA
ncbi:MAG: hypothetical protein FJ280_22475 [Planctomycetes bacterium]|nr:hypothetical protein [Planctomycetota bacterium]